MSCNVSRSSYPYPCVYMIPHAALAGYAGSMAMHPLAGYMAAANQYGND
jgi:hypothetical protein